MSLDFGNRGEFIVYSTINNQTQEGWTHRIKVNNLTTYTPNQVADKTFRIRSVGQKFSSSDFTDYQSKTTLLFPITDTYTYYIEYPEPYSGTLTYPRTLNIASNTEVAMSTTARQSMRITKLNMEVIARVPDDKQYELTDHLGNVRFVFSDRKLTGASSGDSKGNYDAEMLSATDYYPGGSIMPGRNFSSSSYRYGFMNYEKDDEIKGSGNFYNMGERMYDPRIMRTPSPDKFKDKYPGISPYAFALNNPIFFVDIDGNIIVDKNGNVVTIDRDSEGNITGINATNKKGEIITPDPFTVDMITQVNKTDIGKETIKQMEVHSDQFQYREDKTGTKTEGGPARTYPSEKKGIVTYKMYIYTGYETDGTRFEGASAEEYKNATGVHEPKHILNPAQVILDQTQGNAEDDPNSEFSQSGRSDKFQYENFETEVLKDELKTREQFNSGALDSKPYGKNGGTAREKYKEVINAPKSSDVKNYKPN